MGAFFSSSGSGDESNETDAVYSSSTTNDNSHKEHSYEPPEAVKLRQQASEEAKKRNECFEQSKQVFHKDGAQAKQLSNEGKIHGKRCEQLNEQAANITFAARNSNIDPDTIDLHGLRVKEALKRVEERIVIQKANHRDHLVVIVGAGIHSVAGPKIKPAALELLTRHQLSVTPDKPNHGCIYVEFDKTSTKPGIKPNARHDENSCIIL